MAALGRLVGAVRAGAAAGRRPSRARRVVAAQAGGGGEAGGPGEDALLQSLLADILGEEEAKATAVHARDDAGEEMGAPKDRAGGGGVASGLDFGLELQLGQLGELELGGGEEAAGPTAPAAAATAAVGSPEGGGGAGASEGARWSARSAELAGLSVDKGLKPLLREYKLKLSGKKAELVARIVAKEKVLAAEQKVEDAKAARVEERKAKLSGRAHKWVDKALTRNREAIERGWEAESYNLSMGIEPGQDAPREHPAEQGGFGLGDGAAAGAADDSVGNWDAFDLSSFDMVEEQVAAAERAAAAEAAAAAAAAEAEAARKREEEFQARRDAPKYDVDAFKAASLDVAGMGIGTEIGPTDMATVDLFSGQAYEALALLEQEEKEKRAKGKRRPDDESLGEEMSRRLSVDVDQMLHALVLLEDSQGLSAEQALAALKGALAKAHEGVSGTHYRRMMWQAGRDRRKVNLQVDIDLDDQSIQILSQRMGHRGEIKEQRNDTPMALEAYRRGFLNALRAQAARQLEVAARWKAEAIVGKVVEAAVTRVAMNGDAELELRLTRAERETLPEKFRVAIPYSQQVRGETYTTGDILPVFVQSFEEPPRERRGRDEDEPQRYDFTSDQALNIDTETGSPLSTLRHGEGDALVAQTMATFTCSRRAPELVSGLISQVVPEVGEELVRIVGVAREPGKFTKVAIDVGTSGGTATAAVRLAVGVDGVHARRLRELLQGEQVLFVEYDADPQAYLRNAMDRFWHTDDRSAVSAVLVYNDARTGESIGVVAAKPGKGAAMVGAGAANVRTASDLTGMRLTVVEEEEFEEIMKERDEREARRAEASWRVHAGGRFANAGGEGEGAATTTAPLQVEGVEQLEDSEVYVAGKGASAHQYDLDVLLDGFDDFAGSRRKDAAQSKGASGHTDSDRGNRGGPRKAKPTLGFLDSGGVAEEDDGGGGLFGDDDIDLDALLGSLEGGTPISGEGSADEGGEAAEQTGWGSGGMDEEEFDLDAVLGAAVGETPGEEDGGALGSSFYQTKATDGSSAGWIDEEEEPQFEADSGWLDDIDIDENVVEGASKPEAGNTEDSSTDASSPKLEAVDESDDLGIDGVSW